MSKRSVPIPYAVTGGTGFVPSEWRLSVCTLAHVHICAVPMRRVGTRALPRVMLREGRAPSRPSGGWLFAHLHTYTFAHMRRVGTRALPRVMLREGRASSRPSGGCRMSGVACRAGGAYPRENGRDGARPSRFARFPWLRVCTIRGRTHYLRIYINPVVDGGGVEQRRIGVRTSVSRLFRATGCRGTGLIRASVVPDRRPVFAPGS